MKERNKAVPAVYLILRDKEDVILLRRQGSGYYDGRYSVPAGHVEAGELPLRAMTREALEEIGITVEKKHLALVHTLYRAKSDETGERADFFFSASVWDGTPFICEPNTCDDLRWFPLDQLPKNTVPYVRNVLEHIRNSIPYSEIEAQRTP